MTDEAFESLVRRFERDWRRHGPREILEYLGPSATDVVGRTRLLLELIAIDLEFRWRTPGFAAPFRLEDYVERFPELTSLDRLPIDLIGEEYRARRRRGDRPSHAAFVARFGARHEQVLEELARIDAEVEAETAGPGPAARGHVPAVDPVPVGPLLSHRDYLLRRLVGAGGMGKVYEARHHASGRDVAVKFLRRSLLHEPAVPRRFVGEARTAAGLRHPNIVGTEGLGRTPGGSYFLVMDLVRGPDLAALGRRRPIAVHEAIAWSIQACDALDYAHRCGVVHCDLKPANLLLDAGDRVRVTDFGLARSLAGDTPAIAEVEGTAPFMAPEQACRSWGPIDARTDVYGIGAVLFAVLTGRPPTVGRRLPDVLAAVIGAEPVTSPAGLRPDLPGPLVEVCRRCLSKEPSARFASVRDVREALAGLAPRPERP